MAVNHRLETLEYLKKKDIAQNEMADTLMVTFLMFPWFFGLIGISLNFLPSGPAINLNQY